MPKHILSIEEKEKKGTLRSDRVPKELIKPHKLDRIPPAPKRFSDKESKRLWKKYCEFLLQENRLNNTDLPIVELLVDEWGIYYAATNKIEDLKASDDLVIQQVNQGGQAYETVSSWIKIRTTCVEKIQKLSSEMGMSPASRNKVGIPIVPQGSEGGVRGIRNSIMSLHGNQNRSKQA